MDAMTAHLTAAWDVLVVTHRQADMDAAGSAVGLATTLDADTEIATPDGVKENARFLLDDQSVTTTPDLEAYDLVVVVDAPSTDRIAPCDPTTANTPYVLFDHHEPADLHEHAVATRVDESAPATALLVADALAAGGSAIPERGAVGLLAGIVDDAGYSAIFTPGAHERTVELLDAAGESRTALANRWIETTAWNVRMATAKALVRARGYKSGETIVLTTRVSSEETAAAHALLDGNADVALVVADQGDYTRIVGRVADSLDAVLSLPTDVFEPLAESFGGSAGGHAGAASATLDTTDHDAIETHALALVEDALGRQFGEFA
ncbi:DHH family phosphoesterase [Halorubellus salinus]|uniref:DHH family phosphoesterase n=1 Tax=Halorubellus salinus TaxID=755309 RepID=UPI001D08E1C7|nr:DHH family phosphoesterase [Halorubellus salinus]